jgi:hypothetical protein
MKLRPRDSKNKVTKRKQDMNPKEILEKKQKTEPEALKLPKNDTDSAETQSPMNTVESAETQLPKNAADSPNSSTDPVLANTLSSSATINNHPGQHTALIETLTSPLVHESLFALQELSEILSIATEDQFLRQSTGLNPTLITKNLLQILQTKTHSDLLPDQMLMSCRCLYNLIEAFPSCINKLVELKGVDCLVDKLLEIEYIDLAEQVMKILEGVSQEFPSAVLKSNGLFALLQYMDFFGIHVKNN